MNNKGNHETVFKDQPSCSHQQQDEDKMQEIKSNKKELIDKMIVLHQALSQANVVRTQRIKQQRLSSPGMKGQKCQFTAEKHFSQSKYPSEKKMSGTGEFMKECISAIKNHRLYPIIELMLEKCEAATWNFSQASFVMDDVVKQLEEMGSAEDILIGDNELDVFLIDTILMLRVHLLELEKVAELSNDFKTRYLQTLKKKVNQESLIGYNGDSEDDLCNSSAELPGQSNKYMESTSRTIAMMNTSDGMVSIPLWDPTLPHSSSMSRLPLQPDVSTNHISIKCDAQPSFEGDSSDPKRKTQLPTKAVDLLKTWLFLHSSHPYPNEEEKAELSRETGLQLVQINNWFVNARRRILVNSKAGSNSKIHFDSDVALIQEISPNDNYTITSKSQDKIKLILSVHFATEPWVTASENLNCMAVKC